ncbi:MAG: ribonuclease Z [Lachnospiraceae bacterium]|nr:ribonuclease Z [Lachnospiraceae bacterium]
MLDVCLLGTGGMTPMPHRWLTSLMLRSEGSNILIDCGEGTQIALKEVGWSPKAIDIMCFTHYHADHISGLPGMLLNMTNSDRTEPVVMIGPKGLFNIVKSLRCIAPELSFEMRFIELDQNTEEYKLGPYVIKAFKVKHAIQCYGYSVTVPRKGKFDPEAAKAAGIPMNCWGLLQKGEIVKDERSGSIYRPEMVMGPERRGIKVTYTTDTRPCDNIVNAASDTDIFICEGMYGDPDCADKARSYKHCTMQEAVHMAAEAKVSPRQMWLTHYSPSMINPKQYLDELKKVFPAVKCGKDGMTAELNYDED